MESNKQYRLGELIEQSNELNNDGDYTEQHVRGIANTKEFMPTKADINGRDLSKFQVVKPKEFAFNRRTTRMGEKIAIGFNESDENIIVTEDYVVFNVRDKEVLMPEFLFIFLNRGEFDRYARWDSWGSATEFFNWENMCAVHITLPAIAIQQKVVAVYNEMKENLVAYESGLEDLKLTCDGFIEDLRRNNVSKEIGEYIVRHDVRNSDNKISNVMGISVLKQFRKPSSKVDVNNLSNYKVVKPRQVAFVQTTNNEKVFAYAFNDSNEDIVVSSVDEVFSIDEERLYPEYLCMWFNRTEFDRYARFNSWGTARETFVWSDLIKVKIPIPDIRVQKSIADIYSCYIERKRIAEELREQLKNICPILLRGALMATD